jgi:cbb3-type cytochrome oxidase subunit 3
LGLSADLAYLAFTVLLAAILAAIAVHSFSAKRKGRVEAPKYRMLDDDDDTGGKRP